MLAAPEFDGRVADWVFLEEPHATAKKQAMARTKIWVLMFAGFSEKVQKDN